MRKVINVLMILALISSTSWAAKVVDDFEDGEMVKKPEWWVFGSLQAKVDSTKGQAPQGVKLGKKSLYLNGSTRNWYIGGLGTYIGIDGSVFTTLVMDVQGFGKSSGQLKIELADDDNSNWKCEQDPKANYAFVNDDKFVYSLIVDWTGWKRVEIPLSWFADDNPKVGDNIWNPDQKNGSGGFLQMSFVGLSNGATGGLEIVIDQISLASKATK